jgi:hypothetical protein
MFFNRTQKQVEKNNIRIYSTRGDENPGSTAPEAMEAKDLLSVK